MSLWIAVTAAHSKEQPRQWQPATVVDVFSPDRQKRTEPKSLDPSVTPVPRQSPFPIYMAPGGNTRWVFVFESGNTTYIASSTALRGDSPLRKLQPDKPVEVARQGKKDFYVRIEGGKEEKLALLEVQEAALANPAKDR